MPFAKVDHGPALVDALTRQRRMGGHTRRGGEVPSLLVPQRPAHPQLVPRGDPRCPGTGHNKRWAVRSAAVRTGSLCSHR